ncbi:helix-turn-helix transcriptional regulator [Streptomyces sp. H27-H1]|uniref:helix-turn-helix domain-containing protein n=1 Tax=unclassified Streptomyces TaxID=2593676 RepID=UPI00226F99C1|nr:MULTISPECIES: helix-turn-helix transcriptional regulator [unclassified Streptomyces]MCY0929497.1 helix-turn-helix transcriptional regulator [Streptomyces sp. H27-H1]MCY0938834.1 helix-turn-helix transcriptional regulator [Streptomyces sp. H34-S4]
MNDLSPTAGAGGSEGPVIESASPALCRLQLGVELRAARVAANMKATEVARHFSWAGSKLTRLETADNGQVEPSDVAALCALYGVDKDKAAELGGYATVTKTKKDWWQRQDVRDVSQPGFKAYLGLEGLADQVVNLELEFVPGLLQTEEYVRVIMSRASEGLPADQLDLRVAVRMTRQEVLRRNEPTEFTAFLSEAVLRRQVGGPNVMRAQLAHIAKVADELPNVKVQVLPFDRGAHAGMNGSFTYLKLPQPLKPIVYLESLGGAGVSRRDEEVRKYEAAIRDLQAIAPGYEESLEMIRKASKEI